MSNIKKRQHYVWRYYLRPWAEHERIWTYLKEKSKLVHSGLMGVAQEKYFYKLVEFTREEEEFLRTFIENISSKTVRELNLNFFTLFTSPSKLKTQLENHKIQDVDIEGVAHQIEKLSINLMEDMHARIELMGQNLLKCRTFQDLKNLEKEDKVSDSIMFLCFQYLRTNKMKKAIASQVNGGNSEELIRKAWNVLSYALATTLAHKLSVNEDLRFILLNNTSGNHFITGDQPVFNLLYNTVDENGGELELYMPLSPTTALRILVDPLQTEKYIEQQISIEEVDDLNRKIFEYSDFFVFASSKEQLEKYM